MSADGHLDLKRRGWADALHFFQKTLRGTDDLGERAETEQSAPWRAASCPGAGNCGTGKVLGVRSRRAHRLPPSGISDEGARDALHEGRPDRAARGRDGDTPARYLLLTEKAALVLVSFIRRLRIGTVGAKITTGSRDGRARLAEKREDFTARRRDADRVLVLGRQGPIARHSRPAVGKDLHVRAAEIDHGLDGEIIPSRISTPSLASRSAGCWAHRGDASDSMAAEVAHDEHRSASA